MTTFWINLSLHSCLCPKVCCGSADSFACSNPSTEVMDCNYAISHERKEKTLTLSNSQNINWLSFPSTTDAPAWPFLILLTVSSVSGMIRTFFPEEIYCLCVCMSTGEVWGFLKQNKTSPQNPKPTSSTFFPIFHFHTPVSQTGPEAKLPNKKSSSYIIPRLVEPQHARIFTNKTDFMKFLFHFHRLERLR